MVQVRDAEQADALMLMMLTSAGAKCSARLVWADPEGKLKLPIAGEGKDNSDVRIHHFAYVDFLSPGTPLPTLKHAPTAAKAVPMRSHYYHAHRFRQAFLGSRGLGQGLFGSQGSRPEMGSWHFEE